MDQSLTPEPTPHATPMDQSISPENETQDTLSISQKRKRHQVKLACMACRKRHAACDDTRPCKQCVKHNTLDQCIDRPRKKRRASVDMGPKHNILEQCPYGRRAFSVDFSSMRNNENEFVFCESELPQYQSRFPVVEQSKPLTTQPHESFVNTYSIPQYTKTSNTITPHFTNQKSNDVPQMKTDNMSPLTNSTSSNTNSPVFDPNDVDTSVTDLEAYAVNLSMDDLVTVPHALFRDVITRNFSMRSQISSMTSEISDLKNTISENQTYIQHLREQQQLQQQQIQKQQQQLHHQQQQRGQNHQQQIQSYPSNFLNYTNIPTSYHPSKNSRTTQLTRGNNNSTNLQRRYSICEGNPRFYQQYQSVHEKFQQPQPLQLSPQPLSTFSQQPLMTMSDQQSNEQDCQNDDSYQDISDQEDQYVQYSSQYSPESFPYSINQPQHESPKQINISSQPQPLQTQPQPYQQQPQPYQQQPQPYQSQPQPYQPQPQQQPQPYQPQPQPYLPQPYLPQPQPQPQLQPQPHQPQPQPQTQPQPQPQPYQPQPQPQPYQQQPQPYQQQPQPYQPLQSQISQSIEQYCSEFN